MTCSHDNLREVQDMPKCDPVTYENFGRFDVVLCTDCGDILSEAMIEAPRAPPTTPEV